MRNFQHTLDGLVKAYLNNTLSHGNCEACAVGNIVGGGDWAAWFVTAIGKQYLNPNLIGKKNKIAGYYQIQNSGYSKVELMRIEFAFETALKGKNEDDWMFNGLMAVLDVLADIHQVDLSEKRTYQNQFEEIFNS